jgi:Putative Actinobacterial Holin-X, holin superfamily III
MSTASSEPTAGGAGAPGAGRPVGAPERPGGERTLGQLVADASKDLSAIVRSEVALAKVEVKRDVVAGVAGAALFVVAGVFAFLALILLLIAAAYGLVAAGLSPWLAFLIVGGALLVIGALLGVLGKSRLGRIGPPERTIASTKQTVATLKRSRSTGA